MPSLSGRILLLLPALFLLAGCTTPEKSKGKSPLVPARMSPDSCVLEIFFVRFPFDDPEVNFALWQEIDEQHFPAELRQRLVRNGFRVGLVDGQIPVTLSRLLELADKPPPTDGHETTDATELEDQPRILRRRLHLRAGRRSEIVASGIHEQLPVLIRESSQLTGQTYHQAQAVLAARAFPEDDGRVRLELIPELHHDAARPHWVGSQGMMWLRTRRPRRVFAEMGISATLSPGSMLVLGSLPNRLGSLGHHFFTEDQGQLEQKLLVIRLAQIQHDELFSPPEVLPLEEDL